MGEDYFKETKSKLEAAIPDFGSAKFKEMQEKIRKELENKENDFLLQVRSLKVLVLGDWYAESKKQVLHGIRDTLLHNGYYAQTIDAYYDVRRHGGLPSQHVLEPCCINHQLIVFLDGDGKGTITEQEYLRQNYGFQGKVLFFIDATKFDKLKGNPKEYFRIFPSIIPYSPESLNETVLTFSALRLYRLADIIQMQGASGRGLSRPNYEPWSKRLSKRPKKRI